MGDLWPSINTPDHASTGPCSWTEILINTCVTDSIPLHSRVACDHLHQPGDRRYRGHGTELDHERQLLPVDQRRGFDLDSVPHTQPRLSCLLLGHSHRHCADFSISERNSRSRSARSRLRYDKVHLDVGSSDSLLAPSHAGAEEIL